MESIWLEYAWTLLILIGLEGLLSADNALVLAVIAKHLPNDQKKSDKLWNHNGICLPVCGAFCHFVYRKCLADSGDRSSVSSLPGLKACN